MTDLEIAQKHLAGHTIALCRDGQTLTSDLRGIAPMVDFISRGVNLVGYSVADLVVGKAAALLFVKAGIKAVYAEVLSESGKTLLEQHGIAFSYKTLTDKIINRTGTDVCPMEKAVADVSDSDEAFQKITDTLNRLQNQKR